MAIIPQNITHTSGVNPCYLVTITSTRYACKIEVPIPREFGFRLTSEFTDILSGIVSSIRSLKGGAVGFGLDLAQAASGYTLNNQFGSLMSWTGSSPINILLPLRFYAKESALQEVMIPISKLAMMTLPALGRGDFFVAPGPRPDIRHPFTFDSGGDGGDRVLGADSDEITVSIGNFIKLSHVIFTGVDITFEGRLDPAGYPMQALASLSFRSYYTFSSSNIAELFPGVPAAPDFINGPNPLGKLPVGANQNDTDKANAPLKQPHTVDLNAGRG